MSPDMKNNKSKTSFISVLLGGFIALVISIVAYFVARLVCGTYLEVDPKMYGRMFMAWRLGGGDSSMILGRYKPLKATDLPSKDEVKVFIDKAQKEECLLISGNYPEHYPREPEYQWSLADGKNGAYYKFLALRLRVIAKLEGTTVEGLVKQAKTGLKEKNLDKTFKEKFFIPDSKITSNDVKGFFDGKEVEIWKNAAPDFVTILENLYKEKANYKFDGEKVGSELDKDIKQMCKKLGYENVSSDQIAKFFKDLGTINTTSHESNIYSRFFYLFVFLTINNNYDYIQESTGKSKKDTNENEVKMLELAKIYAQIVSRVFPESYDYEDKDISVFKKVANFFGPNLDVSKAKNQDKNIKSALETAKKNVESLAQ